MSPMPPQALLTIAIYQLRRVGRRIIASMDTWARFCSWHADFLPFDSFLHTYYAYAMDAIRFITRRIETCLAPCFNAAASSAIVNPLLVL